MRMDGLRMELIGSSELFASNETSPSWVNKRGKFTLEPVKPSDGGSSVNKFEPKQRTNFLQH